MTNGYSIYGMFHRGLFNTNFKVLFRLISLIDKEAGPDNVPVSEMILHTKDIANMWSFDVIELLNTYCMEPDERSRIKSYLLKMKELDEQLVVIRDKVEQVCKVRELVSNGTGFDYTKEHFLEVLSSDTALSAYCLYKTDEQVKLLKTASITLKQCMDDYSEVHRIANTVRGFYGEL